MVVYSVTFLILLKLSKNTWIYFTFLSNLSHNTIRFKLAYRPYHPYKSSMPEIMAFYCSINLNWMNLEHLYNFLFKLHQFPTSWRENISKKESQRSTSVLNSQINLLRTTDRKFAFEIKNLDPPAKALYLIILLSNYVSVFVLTVFIRLFHTVF